MSEDRKVKWGERGSDSSTQVQNELGERALPEDFIST